MKDFFKLYSKKTLKKLWILITLEQLIVASSTYFLIRTINFAGNDHNSTLLNLMFFLVFIVTAYIPGIFNRRYLEELIQQAYSTFLNKTLTSENSNAYKWFQKKKKESFLNAIGSEGVEQIRQVTNMFFDLYTLIINIIFNLIILGLNIHESLAYSFILGIFLSYFLFKYLGHQVEIKASKVQNHRLTLFSHIFRAWDNVWIATKIHKTPYLNKLNENLDNLKKSSVSSVFTNETSSIVTTFGVVIPILINIIFLAYSDWGKTNIQSLIVTLPRQFQIIGNIQVLISYITSFTALIARARILFTETNINELDTKNFINPAKISITRINGRESYSSTDDLLNLKLQDTGRYLISGENGAGKSTVLISLKMKFGEAAYLLPANCDFWINEENRVMSSGEKLSNTLNYAINQELPRVLLLDEWDANLDSQKREHFNYIISELSKKHLVFEIRHGQKI